MRGFFVFNGVVGIFTKGNQRFACKRVSSNASNDY